MLCPALGQGSALQKTSTFLPLAHCSDVVNNSYCSNLHVLLTWLLISKEKLGLKGWSCSSCSKDKTAIVTQQALTSLEREKTTVKVITGGFV